MSAINITKISRATLAGIALLIVACLLLSVTQARAETMKGRTAAFSLAEVTLEPGTKVLVILGTGEKIKGKAASITEVALSVSTKYGIRRLGESEIFQIFQIKGRTRARGALYGALIGTVAAVPLTKYATLVSDTDPRDVGWIPFFALAAGVAIPSGATIGALVSGEEKKLVYQNPTISYNGRRITFSLAEVSLERGAKLLVVLENGERIKGRARRIADGTLSVSIKDGSRIFSESEISQIYLAKGRSRARGALAGALLGTIGAIPIPVIASPDHPWITFFIAAAIFTPAGAAIGVEVSGEKHELAYQKPTNSTDILGPEGATLLLNLNRRYDSPSDSKTGLINFRDGRLSFAVPSIYLRSNLFVGFRVTLSKRRNKLIDLVRVNF